MSIGDPMTRSLRAGVIAVAAIAIGIGLSGCGSNTKSEPSTSKQTSAASSSTKSSSSAAPTKTPQAAGPNKTIVDYIKENSINETPVHRGDAGAPTIDLPFPPGWEDAGSRTPDWAYAAIVSTDPAMEHDPPLLI